MPYGILPSLFILAVVLNEREMRRQPLIRDPLDGGKEKILERLCSPEKST